MKGKVLVGVAFLYAVSLLVVSNIRAEDQKKPSIEDQLNQIINSQKMLEQRLSAIEVKEGMIINAFGAFANALRPGGAGAGAGGGGGCGPGGQAGGPPPEDYNKVHKIDLGSSTLMGKKDAKITIVEFSDFQCPFSRRFHPAIEEVLKAYPNDVNFIFKNLPLAFHQQAKPAAKATLAAREQGKYWEMVDALFQAELKDDVYPEVAKKIGLNVEKFNKDLKEKDAEWEKLIQEDLTMAGKVEARGTPTFYLNGKRTTARDLASYKAEIEKILKEQKK